MFRFKMVAFAFLILCGQAFGQNKIRMSVVPTGSPAPITYKEVTLELGQMYTVEFATADNKAPFGGQPYSVECEAVGSNTPSTWIRGLVPLDNNYKNLAPENLIDTATVFVSDETPDAMVLRAVCNNRTVFRANITAIKKKKPPQPSPYLAALTTAAALDHAQPVELSTLAMAYKNVAGMMGSLKTGRDVWSAIGIEYLKISAGSLIQTRDAISKILMSDTVRYYDLQLTADDSKALKLILVNIETALEALAAGPTPSPPTPGPPTPNPVSPSPFSDPGFRVLIVYKTADKGKIPQSQDIALRAAALRTYLNAKCVKVDSTPEWRIWPDDVDTANEKPIWQNAMKLPRASTPWIYIGDGQKGISCALPADTDGVLKLLQQYGGQ